MFAQIQSIDMNFFSPFGVGKSLMKFVQAFKIHPVYISYNELHIFEVPYVCVKLNLPLERYVTFADCMTNVYFVVINIHVYESLHRY